MEKNTWGNIFVLNSIVLSNGTLDEGKIVKREILYKGNNGRFVERFYLTPTQSYIFKPLTNETQIGKEVWIQKHILTYFPKMYPKIIAYSINQNASENWMIFEDVGRIHHAFTRDLVKDVTKQMAWWHQFPIEPLQHAPLQAPKPQIEEIVEQVVEKKDEVLCFLAQFQIAKSRVDNLFSIVEGKVFTSDKVLSHGDLHCGNFGYAQGKMVILDWEHAHLNIPYWDLFHLLDISHPVFPRTISKDFRNDILDLYCVEHGISGYDIESFKLEYYIFSAVFSLWMLLLINQDLQVNHTIWTTEQLTGQLRESVSCFIQCLEEIEDNILYEECQGR